MIKALVGYTGFVGSNLCLSESFEKLYNSKNIDEAFGTAPELLVYAGVRAEKYLANQNSQADKAHLDNAFENIIRINPKNIVLISTIDVLSQTVEVDESFVSDLRILQNSGNFYGANRYILEQRVREKYPDALIVRLPALFGKNIKKNFIYDFIHRIPFKLKADKLDSLCEIDPKLRNYYTLQTNGIYQLLAIDDNQKQKLKSRFQAIGFDALHFTDSRNIYQFYPLNRLWEDIQSALQLNIRLLHTATEPVSAAEVYEFLTHRTFVNEITQQPANYNYRSMHAEQLGGYDGYLYDKERILREIQQFVESSIQSV